jgi:hypothetical protein
MNFDAAESNPALYTVVFENDRVRVLEYRDRPGERSTPHAHPDSVMVTLSGFRRRLHQDGVVRDVERAPGYVGWLPAQEHSGENIGDTDTHVLFVELKSPSVDDGAGARPRRCLPRPTPGGGCGGSSAR